MFLFFSSFQYTCIICYARANFFLLDQYEHICFKLRLSTDAIWSYDDCWILLKCLWLKLQINARMKWIINNKFDCCYDGVESFATIALVCILYINEMCWNFKIKYKKSFISHRQYFQQMFFFFKLNKFGSLSSQAVQILPIFTMK